MLSPCNGILTKTFYTEMKIYVDKHFQVKITSSSISPEAALASPHPRQGEFKLSALHCVFVSCFLFLVFFLFFVLIFCFCSTWSTWGRQEEVWRPRGVGGGWGTRSQQHQDDSTKYTKTQWKIQTLRYQMQIHKNTREGWGNCNKTAPRRFHQIH